MNIKMENITLTTQIVDRYSRENLLKKTLMENAKFNLTNYINNPNKKIAVALIPKEKIIEDLDYNPFIAECFVEDSQTRQLYHKFTLELFYRIIDGNNYKYDETYGGSFYKVSIPRGDIVIQFLNGPYSMIYLPEEISDYQKEELHKLSSIIKDKIKFKCNTLDERIIYSLEKIIESIESPKKTRS